MRRDIISTEFLYGSLTVWGSEDCLVMVARYLLVHHRLMWDGLTILIYHWDP